MNKIQYWDTIKERLTNEKIMQAALESDEQVIIDLRNQLLTLTKLLHAEEIKKKTDYMLAIYGIPE
jgi:hypothetical protein